MKIAILVAGSSNYFPLFLDRPKCLYHVNGEVQLHKVIEDAKKFVDEKNIIVVGGYKYKYIKEFLDQYYPQVKLKINERYNEPAIYSFRKAIEEEDDDFVFMFGDENISRDNIEKISKSRKKLAILCHDEYYYYSLGIFKLRRDVIDIINDDKYLSMNAIKEVYCFANQKDEFDGRFSIDSGICIGYTIIDFVRRIGKIKKIENPINSYGGSDVDFFHINLKEEYISDLDYFSDTDEYKNSFLMRFYSDVVSDNLKRISHIPQKLKRLLKK